MVELRKDSGEVDYPAEDWLTTFCYLLLRDATSAGVLESIVREIEEDRLKEAGDPMNRYTNGWLAKYARYLADRLRSV